MQAKISIDWNVAWITTKFAVQFAGICYIVAFLATLKFFAFTVCIASLALGWLILYKTILELKNRFQGWKITPENPLKRAGI